MTDKVYIGINDEIVLNINEFDRFAKKVIDKLENRNGYSKNVNNYINCSERKITYYLNELYVIFRFVPISRPPEIGQYRLNFKFDDCDHYAFYNLIDYMTVKLNDAFREQVLKKSIIKYCLPETIKIPIKLHPTKVIWNDPATIVYWSDGDKTVVKIDDWEDDDFDEEKGLAMAIVKKMFGYKDFYKILRGACYVRDGSDRVVWEEKK